MICPKVGAQRAYVVFVVCVYMFFVGNMFIYHVYCAVKGPSWSVLKVKHHGHDRPCFIAMSGLFVWHVFNGFTCIHMLPVHHVALNSISAILFPVDFILCAFSFFFPFI